jgi:gluconolactonase
MSLLDNKSIEIVCSDLGYPEGPVYCSNGDIILVEIRGDARADGYSGNDENKFEPCISRISPAGERTILAKIPGGPNGAAVGPDGDIYICNDGGFDWIPVPLPAPLPTVWFGQGQPPWYTGGKLQKYSPSSGNVTDLYQQCSTRMKRVMDPAKKTDQFVRVADWCPAYPLCGLDDLVFDKAGGMWFTDYGKSRERDKDVTAVYYALPDGSDIKQMIYPMAEPNGIALSPDGGRLYVAHTFERRVLYYELSAPGVIKPNPATPRAQL